MKKYTFEEAMKKLGYAKVDSISVINNSLVGIECMAPGVKKHMTDFPCWVKRVGDLYDAEYDTLWVFFDFVPLSD